MKMPKMDGLAVLRHVKAHNAGVAVVMMSGSSAISLLPSRP